MWESANSASAERRLVCLVETHRIIEILIPKSYMIFRRGCPTPPPPCRYRRNRLGSSWKVSPQHRSISSGVFLSSVTFLGPILSETSFSPDFFPILLILCHKDTQQAFCHNLWILTAPEKSRKNRELLLTFTCMCVWNKKESEKAASLGQKKICDKNGHYPQPDCGRNVVPHRITATPW